MISGIFSLLFRSLSSPLLKAADTVPDGLQKSFFKQNADTDNDKRPCKKRRCVQVYLGIVEVFSYGVLGNSYDFRRHACLPAQSQCQRAAGAEIGKDLGDIDTAKLAAKGNLKDSCHLQKFPVHLADAVQNIRVDHRKYHQK